MTRLHPVTGVAKAAGYAVQGASIPFFVVMMLSAAFDGIDVVWVFYLAPVGILTGAAYGVAYYYRFEYELTADTFDLASGVLSRRSREIPFRRVQNVDISQGIVQRLLGLAVVSIETAGGGDTEATLQYVEEDEADRIQREIRRLTAEGDDRAGEGEPAGGEPTGRPEPATAGERGDRRPTLLFELSPLELLLVSLTTVTLSASMVVAVVAAFLGDATLGLLLSLAEPFGGPTELAGASPPEYGALALASALYGAVATYLVGAVYTFTSYYDFRIGEAGDDLVYERGLLQRYSGSIPVGKIQTFSIAENPLQRAIGYAALRIETAGYGPDGGGGSQSAIPLARQNRVEAFVKRATGIEDPAFDRPPAMARRRYAVRYSLLVAAIVAAAGAAGMSWGIPYWYATTLAFLAAPVGAHLRWANLGYDVRDDHLLVREGFWRRRTHVIPYYRLQTVSTRRTVFQRRLGLASLVIDTASSRTFVRGTPTIHDLSLSTARSIHVDCRERLEEARRARAGEGRALSVAFT